MRRALVLVGCLAAPAHAEELAVVWFAQPAGTATTGAQVRVGVGETDDRPRGHDTVPITILMNARLGIRVTPALQVDLALGGELGEHAYALASPVLGATWTTELGAQRLAVRGLASPAIDDGLTEMSANVASSLLAHDPYVAWSSTHGLAVQASVQGTTGELRWGLAGSVVELVPVDFARHQTLVRADAALAGPLGPCWTWQLELGATSDVLDEEYDEGTDVVPLWAAGVHHHRDGFAIGVSTTGGWIGGTRRDVLGPSVLVDVRGAL